jgi:ubiquitin-conjugating enzyme E2 variant
MDTWFDERTMGRAIAITREHHTHPDHIYGFLENASFGSAPSAVAFGCAAIVTASCPFSFVTWTLMLLWLISSVCLLFGMHFHNLAHKPARSAVMRLAQRLHLVCPPAHHWVHHHNHTIHYCVVNGWANYVCDGLGVWRALECVIAPITGIVPRADDSAWQRNYRETGVLSAPRRRGQ